MVQEMWKWMTNTQSDGTGYPQPVLPGGNKTGLLGIPLFSKDPLPHRQFGSFVASWVKMFETIWSLTELVQAKFMFRELHLYDKCSFFTKYINIYLWPYLETVTKTHRIKKSQLNSQYRNTRIISLNKFPGTNSCWIRK